MGIYPLTFAHLLLGEAEELTATAVLSDTGIDLDIAIAGRYAGGTVATMVASITSWSSRRAEIATDRGRLVLEDFHHPTHATFTATAVGGTNDATERLEPLRIEGDEPVIGRGYGNETVEFQRCLAEGLLESPLVPHAQTLTIMRQMDDLRAQVGCATPATLSDSASPRLQEPDDGQHPTVLGVVRQQTELREDPLGVLLDRALGDHQRLGDRRRWSGPRPSARAPPARAG